MSSWSEQNGVLVKEYRFKDFKQAFAFLQELADVAEQQQHHPKIINEYNWVRLELCTHDAGNAITEKDYKLSESIDKIKTL